MTVTLNFGDLATDASTRRSLADLSLSVVKSKKIVVVTGAGISCSCGIPDFRSSDGLYALVKQQYPDIVLKGRDLFDASLFRDSTSTAVFYTFISQLKQSIDSASPTPTHRFIKTLDIKKKLLRSYTQNIDGLEAKAGLLGTSSQEAKTNGKGKYKINTKVARNVQLHGDIHRVRCMSCSAEYSCTKEHLRMFTEGMPPDCPECLARSQARAARSARPIRVGSLRPAIVLYDEPHPLGDDIGTIQSADISRKPDMLIIMGTSLKVHGLKKLVKDFAKTVHTSAPFSTTSSAKKSWTGKVVFVNRTPPGSEWADIIDYHVAGETDVWVDKVVEDWKKLRPADWEVQQTLVAVDGDVSVHGFKTVKGVLAATAGANGKGKGNKKKSRVNENVPPPVDMVLSTPDVSSFPSTRPIASPPSPSKRREATSKSRGNEENVPPAPVDMVLSTPITSLLPPAKSITPPLSPSKRRQTISHYCDVESSPSKKRLSSSDKVVLEAEERGLLFGDSTNNRVIAANAIIDVDKDVVDLSMEYVELAVNEKSTFAVMAKVAPQAVGKTGRTRSTRLQMVKVKEVEKKTATLGRERTEVWVDIVKTKS